MASAVGFSVYTERDYQFPDSGEIIRFPLIITNNGGHYFPSDSVFICPITGTYYFTFTLHTGYLTDNELTAALIQVDGDRLSEAYCKIDGSNSLAAQCGNSVVTHCSNGQSVSVISAYADTQMDGGRKTSTFSGFLIHEDVSPY